MWVYIYSQTYISNIYSQTHICIHTQEVGATVGRVMEKLKEMGYKNRYALCWQSKVHMYVCMYVCMHVCMWTGYGEAERDGVQE